MTRLWRRLRSYFVSDRSSERITRRLTRELAEQLGGTVTDRFLELLLAGMDIAFVLSRSFRRNIKDFKARYVFEAGDGRVAATADFVNGNMRPSEYAKSPWTVRVRFVSTEAFWRFLFSKDQDILTSVLNNEVEVEGNINYLYKFGFMARELQRRLGLA
jgi:hypothetical protein